MTVSAAEQQITWGGSPLALSKSVTAGGSETSDALSVAGTTFRASVQVKAVNATSPLASDATIDFWIQYSLGDPDASPGTDEFDTDLHSEFLATLDVSSAGEATARKTIEINPSVKSFKILAENNGATDSVTVSATAYEKKVA